MRRTLIINDVVPPVVQGGAILLGRLFKDFPKGSILIFTKRYGNFVKIDNKLILGCPYFFFNLPQYEEKTKWKRRIFVVLQFLYLPWMIIKGVFIVIRNHPWSISLCNCRTIYSHNRHTQTTG